MDRDSIVRPCYISLVTVHLSYWDKKCHSTVIIGVSPRGPKGTSAYTPNCINPFTTGFSYYDYHQGGEGKAYPLEIALREVKMCTSWSYYTTRPTEPNHIPFRTLEVDLNRLLSNWKSLYKWLYRVKLIKSEPICLFEPPSSNGMTQSFQK